MPICIPLDLPAREILENENIFVMDRETASAQDIRPLRAAIVNLMPTKIATETQLLRLLGNSPLQIEVDFLQTASYTPKNTPVEHLERFYTTFDAVKDKFYDMLIITGAPVETLPFEEVAYWKEFCDIVKWGKTHVYSTLYICWAAQAGLHHLFGINKRPLSEKQFGVFESSPLKLNHPLLRGFNDTFYIPHSHHTEVAVEDILAEKKVELLAVSKLAGADIAATSGCRNVFVFGHMEYDTETLKSEYVRDLTAGKPIEIPVNYFTDDDPDKAPVNRWRGHANLFFANWINTVYQGTLYDLSKGF